MVETINEKKHLKKLLQLNVSASVEGFFSETQQGYSLCKAGLYELHSHLTSCPVEVVNQSHLQRKEVIHHE